MKRFPLPPLLIEGTEYDFPTLMNEEFAAGMNEDLNETLVAEQVGELFPPNPDGLQLGKPGLHTKSVGLVRLLRGAPGEGFIEVDETKVESVRIASDYETDQARRQARREKFHREHTIGPSPMIRPEPYIHVTVYALNGDGLTLYWAGDGFYDGWSVSGRRKKGSPQGAQQ